MNKSDLFATMEAKIERARDLPANNEGVDLVFKPGERGSSTELGKNEGSARASARVRNVFGGAETFTANSSLGTTTKRTFRASLVTPLTSDLDKFAELAAR
ncbi:uncharacterized protein LACBIDRAFT_315293 [Laccaria bicolor S238N-H82]|uniref:Predicted protein n=1 Tax=Laccaria bicolor (strain S238N-H82 / ATCC MYA-4686) TaxID=486041 RepID=B0E096_LACBS|nr:uncharacterized protein LACBIDRAFT_315293 [Laccaria bicolor S238N-H82]EDQ99785.1 predicted protein [Laccaria bicolor S238N-H82]|eukprot:XP_001889621.1 predicted protein [Laccaria bicolor S238N-H82]